MSAQHSFPETIEAREKIGEFTSSDFRSAPEFGGVKPNPSEFAGRVALSAGLIALTFAVWMVSLPAASSWTGLYTRMAPRLSVFGLGLFTALAVQGCRVKARTLGVCAILALAGMFSLQKWAGLYEVSKLPPEIFSISGGQPRDWSSAGGNVFLHARADMLGPGTTLLLMRLECALFAAVFLGTWIGRGAWRAWHFMTLLMFAGLCDAWLNGLHVPESVEPSAPLAALRMPFAPALGRTMTLAPAFTDILFVSAAFEASRVFRIHVSWLALSAIVGYCHGGFFGQAPFMSMPLLAIGMIVAAWPDMKLDQNSVGKALLALALLILSLAVLQLIHNVLNSAPAPNNQPREQMRNVAEMRPRILFDRESTGRSSLTANRANLRESTRIGF